jgi:hypothetical protein
MKPDYELATTGNNDVQTHTHICCYHATGIARLTAPPQWEEKCCHCGDVQWRQSVPVIDPRLHGPFLPYGSTPRKGS